MPEYRRVYQPGGTFFFTVVTYERRPIFLDEFARITLREAFQKTRERFPYQMHAICLLPDHLHCMWTLPENDTDYSTRWRFLKTMFTYAYHSPHPENNRRSASRAKRREANIWQRRFWERLMKDEAEYSAHIEYIHKNPVKHGLVESAEDWPWSSFQRWGRDEDRGQQ